MKRTTLKPNWKTNTLLALSISSAALAPTLSHADFGLSLNMFEELDEYKKDNNDIELLLGLGIEYRGKNFNMDQSGISYDLSQSDKYGLEVFATSKNIGFSSGDGEIFKGMKERDTSLDLGGRAIIKTGFGPVTIDATRDVLSSKGFGAGLKLGGIEPHNAHWNGKKEVTVAPVIGVRYQSKEVVDYYYGVKNSEATADRSAYTAKAATTPFIGLEAQANFTKRVSMNANLGYQKRPDSIKNSPLTDNHDGDLKANIGLSYWF